MLQPYKEILANLAIPLPKECISSYQRQGKTIRYVKPQVIMMCLDKYAPGWTTSPPEVYEVCGMLMVKLALTIRAQEGEFTQVALGWDEKIEDESYGGPIPKAYATAFRRAAMLFGFERRLWDDDQTMGHLLAHWRTERTPEPIPDVKVAPGWHPPEDAPMDWTICYNDLLTACVAADFDQVRVIEWLKRVYGGKRAHWTERDMTPLELQDATHRVEARDFDARQLRYLMGERPARTPCIQVEEPTAAGGSV